MHVECAGGAEGEVETGIGIAERVAGANADTIQKRNEDAVIAQVGVQIAVVPARDGEPDADVGDG